MNILNNQKGQTLLEMLVALFILVAATTATIVLIVTSINAGKESRYKMIATNLAREAIEVVRNIRDSNWIDDNDVAWNEGLTGTNPAYPKITLDDARTIEFSPLNEFDANMQIWFDNNTYTFLQGAGVGVGEAQNFYRYLYFSQICHDISGDNEKISDDKDNNDDCGAGVYIGFPNKAGFRVVAEVHWNSADSDDYEILEERFYDWQIL